MPTWPSTKASTTNLDAGTDKPSLARADLKQNVDNVNDIIDTLYITSPSANQILKYNLANTRFELTTTISTNVIEGITTNGAITITPNGTGDVQLVADTVQVGDSNANATITTNGTGDLILNTNNGTNSGSITIADAANGNITLAPNGTGKVIISGDLQVDGTTTTINSTTLDVDDINITIAKGAANAAAANGGGITLEGPTTAATITYASADDSWNLNKLTKITGNLSVSGDIIAPTGSGADLTLSGDGLGNVNLNSDTVRIGDNNTDATLTTHGTGDLIFSTNAGTNSGTIRIYDGANANIELQPNGTGYIDLFADTVRIGDSNANVTLTTNGTGNLILNTNAGTNSGTITINQGANANIELAPNGTGDVHLTADTVRVGDSNANATITTNGTGDLILNTNAGTNSGSITIEDAANGDITLAPNGTGRVEIPGTTSQSGGIRLFEELTSAGNTNSVVLRAPQVIQNDITLTLPSGVTTGTLGYLNVPAVGTKTGSYTLTTADVGEYVQVGSGGSITIPNATFAEGDVIMIVNNHTAAITITCTITDAYIAGTDTDKASVSLATRGVASLFFLSGTRVIISGNVT